MDRKKEIKKLRSENYRLKKELEDQSEKFRNCIYNEKKIDEEVCLREINIRLKDMQYKEEKRELEQKLKDREEEKKKLKYEIDDIKYQLNEIHRKYYSY